MNGENGKQEPLVKGMVNADKESNSFIYCLRNITSSAMVVPPKNSIKNLLLLCLLLFLTDCLALILPAPTKPEVRIPINLSVANDKVYSEFETFERKHTRYVLAIFYLYDSQSFDSIRRIAGEYVTLNGKVIKSGIPVYIDIELKNKSDGSLLLSKSNNIVDEGPIKYLWIKNSKYAVRRITAVTLPPGKYTVQAINRKAIPELSNINTFIAVINSHVK